MIEIVGADRPGRKPASRRIPTQLELAAEIRELVRVLLTCGDDAGLSRFERVISQAEEIADAVESACKSR